MIVIAADPHKQSHTAAAVDPQTGELQGSETVKASPAGHEALLRWGRALDQERVWALEDCRHVSGRLERFLLARGERVVRVAPKLMAQARRSARERGKSDAIDALAVARAALREGIATLPTAAATASSTWPSTALPSTAPNTTPRPPPTSIAKKPKDERAWTRCAASSATSSGASTS